MIFLKKFMLAFAALALILGGGAGTQSTSTLLQGGGFIGLVIGLVVLYIFTKMAWRAMGCLPSFLAFGGIVAFVLYAIGGLNNGVNGIGNTIKTFLGQPMQNQQQTVQPQAIQTDYDNLQISETFDAPTIEEDEFIEEQQPSRPQVQQPSEQPQQPNVPMISGPAKVLKANVLEIEGRRFILFGIDAPDLRQSCADARGRAYKCGSQGKEWLKSWIQDYPLDCRIMQKTASGDFVGACALGEYDLGAALVASGWAVAYRKSSDIYVPYEQEARRGRQGLWRGQFYMPWDWRNLQTKKPKIKIIEAEKPKKGWFD